jgi:type I restriction enzyme, S subunit
LGNQESSQKDGENSLPNGWIGVPLGEIAISISPGFPSGKHNQERRGVLHFRPMNISITGEIDLSVEKYVEESAYDPLLKGDIIFNNTNSPELVGKTTCVKQDTNWAYSNHMTKVRVNTTLINPAWIASFLHTHFLQGYFKMLCTHHVNQASINSSFLSKNVYIPLPPLTEQHRIVTKIEELLTQLDAGVTSLKKAQAQLKRYRQAVLKAAFEGRLTQEWRKEHKGKIEPASELLKKINNSAERKTRRKYDIQNPIDVTAQPTLPKEWVLTQVQNVGTVQLGRQRAPEHHYGPNMRPYLRVANVFENRIDLKDVKSMNFTDDEFDTYHLEYGDILLNEGQSKELVGRPAIFRDEIRDVCFQNTLVRFRVYDGIIPEYALHLFLFYLQNGRFLKIASQSTNIAHLGAERFAKMSFPLAPLTEQKQILLEIDRHISQIDHLENTITTSLCQAKSLRQSILKQAFEGKLVPQDPNDEPASILLERIKAEKTHHAAESKKGKTLQPKSPKRKIKNGN